MVSCGPERWFVVYMIIARATTDRNSSNARGGSQVGGRHGGMNDAPLTNKVRVAPPPPHTKYVLPTDDVSRVLFVFSSCVLKKRFCVKPYMFSSGT